MVLCACSVIYDDGAFQREDPSADPCEDIPENEPRITGIAPSFVHEGQGCISVDGSCSAMARPVPVVVEGCNLAPEAVITLDGAGLPARPIAQAIAADGTLAAFAIAVPVTPSAVGQREPVTVEITHGGAVSMTSFDVVSLDELLVIDGAVLPATDDLDPLYSRIEIRGEQLRFAGQVAARLRATSEIIVAATLDAGGLAGQVGGGPGPGGQLGGAAASPGQGQGGGQAGSSHAGGTLEAGIGGGGGGGGHGHPGDGGAGGVDGGQGGPSIGDPFMASLTAGQGGGGGGNGQSMLGSPAAGGRGGGGGGVIELTSQGVLRFETGATILVDGGAGESGDSAGDGCGGGGGGGSGGAVLLRAAHALQIDDPGDAWLSARGGPGGPATGQCSAGGKGGGGKVRLDLPDPDDSLVPGSQEFVSRRGPVIARSLPVITDTGDVSIEVFGAPGERYFLGLLGGELPDQIPEIDRNEAATAAIELEPGLNEVCVLVSQDASIARLEGLNCLAIAFIPQ